MGPISLEISVRILSTQFARPNASPAKPSTVLIGFSDLFLEAPLEQALDVGGKGPPRFLMAFSVLPFRFSISLMARVLIAGRVISVTQLRPSLTNPRSIPPNTDLCDDAAGALLGNEVMGIPPAWVVLGTSNEVADEDPEVSVGDPDGADTPAELDVADGPGVVAIEPGARVLFARDVMEAVAFLDIADASCDCAGDVVVMPVPGSEPP